MSYLVFVGEEEATSELYPFKVTASTDEQRLSFSRIVSTVKDRRLKRKAELDDLFV